MEDFWYKAHLKNGYELVRSPHIGSQTLWEKSGHWNFYRDNMYSAIEVDDEKYLLKPMNCPFHVTLYNARPRSYRELPLRWAECGTVYRYEKSGELSGLTRVRGFTQDDAHIVCAKSQVESELKRVVEFISYMLSTFGFKEYNVYLSLRDPNKKKYAGNDEGWEFTEKVLEQVAKDNKLNYIKEVGEAAFYGPKLDFKIKDCLGREWQCSTLQFDFNLPERFKMVFVNDQGKEEQPYMLHRALFGSFERFIGVLIEHYAGAFPTWLAPVQIKILPVSDKFIEYALEVKNKFIDNDIRVELDDSAESLGKKIRAGEQERVPYLLIIGEKEVTAKQVAVRQRGKGDLGPQDLVKFIEIINKEIITRA
jgi:threonyl-tRNA synthetase